MTEAVQSAEQFVIHADLRRYGQIERRLPPAAIYEHLNEMHRIIRDVIDFLQPRLVSLMTDTATFSVAAECGAALVQAMVTSKASVDRYFEDGSFDSRLSYACTFGIGHYSSIHSGDISRPNLCGPVMNQLQRLIGAMESEDLLIASAAVVLDPHASDRIDSAAGRFRRLDVGAMKLFILEDNLGFD
jgi:class 3 adenylate cyclase